MRTFDLENKARLACERGDAYGAWIYAHLCAHAARQRPTSLDRHVSMMAFCHAAKAIEKPVETRT